MGLYLTRVAGCRTEEEILQLCDVLLVVAVGLVRLHRVLRVPQAHKYAFSPGIEAEAHALKPLLLLRSAEDRLRDCFRLLALLRVDRRFSETCVHQLHLIRVRRVDLTEPATRIRGSRGLLGTSPSKAHGPALQAAKSLYPESTVLTRCGGMSVRQLPG